MGDASSTPNCGSCLANRIAYYAREIKVTTDLKDRAELQAEYDKLVEELDRRENGKAHMPGDRP